MIARRVAAGVAATLVVLATAACGPLEAPPSDDTVGRTGRAAHAPAPVPAAPAPTATAVVPAADPVVMPASPPVRVAVASIGVDSELMALGLQDDGTMEVPPGAFPAGWFTGAPTPGELGPAVIVGHIDWVTGPGVFHRLGSMAAGDEIRVERGDGTTAVFRTTEVADYPKDQFPTDLVYGDLDHPGLRLISCGGAFNPRTGHYEDNIVVFAELVT